jgi:hypothetical protein
MNYLKPIAILGYIIPGVIMLALFAGLLVAKSWIDGEYATKKAAYEELRENERKIESLEGKVLPYRGAITFFSNAKNENIAQELPPLLEELCSGKYQGYVVRTGLRVNDDGGRYAVNMEFLGRYDSLQKLASELGAQFPYLRFKSGNFSPKEPTTSIPSKHLSASFEAYSENPEDEKGGTK